MFNILVVDDEHNVCEGIRDLLLDSDLDISDIFLAMNGYEALDYTRMERIDLVLTDIQMGEMDGTQLMEAVFMEQPGIPIVVISAYDEFAYAQKCMRLGAKDYLVKPVSAEHLTGVVGKLLANKHRHYEQQSLNRQFSLDGVYSAGAYLLSELVRDESISDEELHKVCGGLGLHLDERCYCLLAVLADLERSLSFRDRNLMRYACLNVMEETVRDWQGRVFYAEGKFIAVLQWEGTLPAAGARERETAQVQMLGKLIHYNLLTYLHLDATVGISMTKLGAGRLREAYRESAEALAQRQYHRDHAVWYAGDIALSQTQEAESPQQLEEFHTTIVQRIASYIQQHYRDKGLSLQDVAAAVYLSPNYVSYLFKRGMGMNLWDYVIQLRMEDARRLLLTSDKKRYEISDEIGYESPEHFSRIFRRYFGVSPNEMRQNRE